MADFDKKAPEYDAWYKHKKAPSSTPSKQNAHFPFSPPRPACACWTPAAAQEIFP